jgi:dynein light chain 1
MFDVPTFYYKDGFFCSNILQIRVMMVLNHRQLSLSSNQIEKISNLNGLDSLKILSLGRNSIKKIEGLEAVSNTLEELWLSYNLIEKLNGIECCKKLRVLYMSNNRIKDWAGMAPAVINHSSRWD